MSSGLPFTALVLPGDRLPEDPGARAAGVPCKALVPVGGVPMLLRVLSALAAARDRKLLGATLRRELDGRTQRGASLDHALHVVLDLNIMLRKKG